MILVYGLKFLFVNMHIPPEHPTKTGMGRSNPEQASVDTGIQYTEWDSAGCHPENPGTQEPEDDRNIPSQHR